MLVQPESVPTADGMLICSQLTFPVDPDDLLADLARLRPEKRRRQPGSYHDGEWQGISLRSIGGRLTAGAGLPGLSLFRDTQLMREAPAVARLLARIPAPKLSIRMLHLPPGGEIRAHVDDFTGFWHGILRLHVPIVTNRFVTISIGGALQTWEPGVLWYGNFCLPHSVANRGQTERVHLVVDTLITEELLDLFPQADRARLAPAEITLAPRRPKSALPDIREFERIFAVPTALARRFMPALIPRFGLNSQDWLVAQIVRRGSRLILSIAGVPVFRLEPIDATTLRIANWSMGVILRVPRYGDPSAAVRLELRLARPFLPRDLRLAPETLELPMQCNVGR
jgi:aspartate beta-hydroxylase